MLSNKIKNKLVKFNLYFILCVSGPVFATFLKKSRLSFVNNKVTFSVSSFNTNSRGLGKKSGTTFIFQIGSSV